ncbi:type VI secretion system membrane subunit TssM [Caballeronia sp. LZ035]|uniref:type VI secretion system membrane subunit TssM n=1 Tax=Caballeronia sp. LZ035 TaxID=3038568 RepID=UPI00285A57EC|nr:type VI secretion system membrane subunit TssM [Caballeronia sp. LZ035]MDR5759521.1 type VI secretion system membrane subunit TssM [Caballeronia sp. LZ035]
MSFFQRIRSALFSREMAVTIMVLIVVWIIWNDFSIIAIGNAHPFDTPEAREWLIAAVLLIWAIWLLWRLGWIVAIARACGRTRTRWVDRAEVVRQRRVPLGETEKRLRDALTVLRRGTHERGKPWRGWLDRLTGHYVYTLPWYALLGADGAGKTSFIREAGLAQPKSSGPASPLEDCSWWFGNRCVLVDVPGSFLAPADGSAERFPLMRLLRRHRADQPVNGVILALPVDDLMHADERHCLELIARHRARLQRMQDEAGIVLPVYLVVTKMDRLAGFAETFDALPSEARAQVWGWTRPADPGAAPDVAFESGLAALLDRLNDGLADTLAREPDVRKRQDIYLFPQQFAALRPRLAQWYGELSRHSQYETNLAVRGVYFTSARQGGEPLDLVLGERRERLGLAAAQAMPALAPRLGSTFLARLLPDVLLEESAWAGRNRAQTVRRMLMHGGALLCTGLALTVLAALWTNSYLSNRTFLRDVAGQTADLDHTAGAPLEVPPGDVSALAPLLEMERALPESPAIDVENPSTLSHRMGLYQGDKIVDATGELYRKTLREKLLPVVAVRIHDILEGAPPADLEFTYDALKAYLMLYDQKTWDPEFLAAWLQLNVNHALPGNATKEARSLIDGQLSDLVALGPLASPFPLDNTLVGTVRSRLLQMPFAQRTYHYLRRKEMDAIKAPAISIASAGGPEASLVLTRKSGRAITEGVPALFTVNGYWEHINKDIDDAVEQMRREDHWVLGVPADAAGQESSDSRRQLIDAVKRQYFGDFIQTWDDYLGDIKVVPSQSLVQSMQIARTLSSRDSPLKLFFTAVARQTDLLDGHGAPLRRDTGRIAERIGEARRSLAQMFGDESSPTGSSSGERPESIVDDHFASLRHLVLTGDVNDKGPAPIDDVLKTIDGLYQYLVSVNGAVDSNNPPPQTDVFNRLKAEAGRMPSQMQGIVTDVSKTGEAQVNGMMKRDLRKNAYSSVGAVCAQTIAGRYPFARNSNHDVASSDFSRMFSPGGLMDDFYQKNLTHAVTTSADTASFNSDPGGGFAASFRNASIIRNVFFTGNAASMSYGFSITPLDLDPAITEFVLDVGGQSMRYAHGPQIPVNMQWPGSHSEVVSLQVVTPSGASGIRTQGPWALQHLFDQASIVPNGNADGFVATFTVDGHKLSMTIRSNSAYDPFFLPQMRAFACPS